MTYIKSIIKLRKEQVLANINNLISAQPNWQSKNTIFIISTGRTGTNFFAHFFNNNFKDVFSTHEPQKDVYDLNINRLRNKISSNQCLKTLNYFRRNIFNNELKHKQFYIESNNNLSFVIPEIRNLFPNYKIIHIKRDGKDVIRSIYSRQATWNNGEKAPILSDQDPRNRLKASFFKDDPFYNSWKDLDRFSRICWYWAKKDSLIMDEIENDANAISIKFEELFKDQNIEKWNDLISFCGLKQNMNEGLDIIDYVKKSKSNKTQQFVIGKYPDWPNEFKESYTKISGEHALRCGYEID